MINTDKIRKTDEKKEIVINGIKKTMDVYNIPIDQLNYNTQNDRIFVALRDSNMQHLSIAEINDHIENLIWKEEEQLNKKTKANIELIGQREVGIVLSNGVVVDGNRRFTCLRKLDKEKNSLDKFKYFKGIILNSEDSNDERAIKALELQIQHGEESKVDYDPIDRSLAVYNDVIVKKMFSIEEYASFTNNTKKLVDKMCGKGQLIEEFLDYINQGKNYKIAKQMKLDGPIEDVYNFKEIDEEKKCWLFDYLFINGGKTNWKEIRNLISSIKADSEKIATFYEKNEKLIEELHERLYSENINDIKNNIDLTTKLDEFMKNVVTINDSKVLHENYAAQLNKATKALKDLDFEILTNYINKDFESEYLDFVKEVNKIHGIINE